PPLPRFPAAFRWGAGTSSYQVEGGVHEGGRGESVWDRFAHTEGTILDASTGDEACDSYHRYAEDVRLLAELGVDVYRFSVAWPRIQPEGTGPAVKAGLDYYDRLLDGLAERGIAAVPTLYHWDLPQALEDQGGWLSRETAYRFAEYAAIMADFFAGRVETVHTLNEPFIHLALGYALGTHAPGRTLGFEALPGAHHQLLGHGLAAAELRARGLRVGLAHNYTPVRAASSAPADIAAAHAYDVLHNRVLTDPLLLGRYADLSFFGLDDAPEYVHPEDLGIIAAGRPDELGVNYYNPTTAAGLDPLASSNSPLSFGLPFELRGVEGAEVTAFGWPIVPDGLREILVTLKDRYGDALPPILVTENGCSTVDAPDPDGVVHDEARIAFLDGHIRALHEAVEAGVDVAGYVVWTLLDNFEWDQGYQQRFGIVRVDFDTFARTPKDSFHWLRALIAEHRTGSAD
ncbi:beta-glucosidase, partial [Actinospica durhamensis]